MSLNRELISVNPIPADLEVIVENYQIFSLVAGLLIIVTNLSVVVASGLILKKAVQPKSTYMLLGNISLADAILGIGMVYAALCDKSLTAGTTLPEDYQYINNHISCMILQGLRMCPSVVSIMSISFIAADRYIYLLHGLYYKTWISTKRVRICIVCIWIIGILFTISGWINFKSSKTCKAVDIFPVAIVLSMVVLYFINIAFVTTLYIIILIKAVKATNQIREAKRRPQVIIEKYNKINPNYYVQSDINNDNLQQKSATRGNNFTVLDVQSLEPVDSHTTTRPQYNDASSSTLQQASTNDNGNDTPNKPTLNRSVSSFAVLNNIKGKCKDNKKYRAITVVVLTTGAFIITYSPFMVCSLYYGYLCDRIYTKEYCEISVQKTIRPIFALAFLNSLLNPFIYAWWHHGFKQYVTTCFKKYFRRVV